MLVILIHRLSAAYAALAEIRRKLEAGEVKPSALEQTLASARAAFEEGQAVIHRIFELIEDCSKQWSRTFCYAKSGVLARLYRSIA